MSVVINVHVFHVDYEAAKVINCVVVADNDYKGVEGGDLQALRELLLADDSVKSSVQRLPFSTPDGAEVRDTVKISDYSALVQLRSEVKQGARATALIQHDVYFRKAPLLGGEWNSLVIAEKTNNGKLRSSIRATDDTGSDYDHGSWKSLTGGIDFDHAVDMTEKQWDAVLRSTNLLSGNLVTFTDLKANSKTGSIPKLQRAAYPAFRIKARPVLSSERSDVSLPDEEVRIPIFQVTDEAYVEVYETKSYMAQAMAQSCFSKTDIEASVSGGGFGYSAEASAGFSSEEKASWRSSHEESAATMHITYNFPRVTVHLDHNSLEVTPECEEALRAIKNSTTYLNFHRKYGQLYPRRVILGGRLYAAQESSSFTSTKESERAEVMKVSASMSFKAPFVQGSASTSHTTGSEERESSTTSKSNGSLTWHANGGDSLLCNNPPAWCPTVASHYYWRIQQQMDTIEILDVMRDMPGLSEAVSKAKNYAP